jgi:putative transposase
MKTTLKTNLVYHVFSKSIADYVVFNSENDFQRMRETLRYYRYANASTHSLLLPASKEQNVQIIAYCLMNTHFHLVLKQLKEGGISIFINKVLNSFTRYFNQKYDRKGPLWEGRFKRILIETDEYLLHLTRYIHLNPVTAYIVNSPEEWKYSSFHEYLGSASDPLCEFHSLFNIAPDKYNNFVKSRIDYQRSLAGIKDLLLDE